MGGGPQGRIDKGGERRGGEEGSEGAKVRRGEGKGGRSREVAPRAISKSRHL